MRPRFGQCGAALLIIIGPRLATAIQLDVGSIASIRAAASTVAVDLMKWYTGDVTNTPETIGVLPRPYYWWEAGALWGAMIDYSRLTGDSTYNGKVTQALLSQVGPNYDYMVPIRYKEEGNDDQAFWGFAIMSAAEYRWAQPPAPTPSWLQLTINLWNSQVARWDSANCGGGLRWQIFAYNNGYDYKNTVSNGGFFLLSARLARYTGNATYLDWAVKTWDWSVATGLIDSEYDVYDGIQIENCASINHLQFSYAAGIMMYGAAILSNYTGSQLWIDRTTGLLDAAAVFFSPTQNAANVMWEPACEGIGTCDNDQLSFKAYLSRFMWASTVVAPFTSVAVTTLLTASAKAAAGSCVGNPDGTTCGQKWYIGGWDGTSGPGQQMSALETIQGLLINYSAPPLTNTTVTLSSSSASVSTISRLSSLTATPTVKVTSSTGAAEPCRAMATAVMGVAVLAFGVAL